MSELEKPTEGVSGESNPLASFDSVTKDTLVMQDVFQVTGYSKKPFYKLTKQEATDLGAKKTKNNLIFFKGVLARGNSVTTRGAIMDMDWIVRRKDLWPGKPITILHPEFKGKIAMNGRDDMDVVKDLLEYQEDFAVGRIMKVDANPGDPNLIDFYGYIDNPGLVKGIESGEVQLPRYGSPYLYALGQPDETWFDDYGHLIVRDHYPIHWSFVPRPAMGPSVEVKAMCSGDELACLGKMQAFSDDSNYNLKKCPCTIIKENFAPNEQIDNSFYLADPITQLSIMTDQDNSKQEEAKKFMTGENKDNNKNSSMPETNTPGGEGGPPNPGEQADRDKAATTTTTETADNKSTKTEEQTPEEKSNLDTMIEEVRTKAAKSAEKKFEKLIAEKDGIIAKLQKENGELRFKEKEDLINSAFPDGLYGNKEEHIKKAQEDREFYIKLAKEKNLTMEELDRMVNGPIKMNLNLRMKTANGQKGQANDAGNDNLTKDQVRDYMLGAAAAAGGSSSADSKSRSTKNPAGMDVNKDQIKSFFGV